MWNKLLICCLFTIFTGGNTTPLFEIQKSVELFSSEDYNFSPEVDSRFSSNNGNLKWNKSPPYQVHSFPSSFNPFSAKNDKASIGQQTNYNRSPISSNIRYIKTSPKYGEHKFSFFPSFQQKPNQPSRIYLPVKPIPQYQVTKIICDSSHYPSHPHNPYNFPHHQYNHGYKFHQYNPHGLNFPHHSQGQHYPHNHQHHHHDHHHHPYHHGGHNNNQGSNKTEGHKCDRKNGSNCKDQKLPPITTTTAKSPMKQEITTSTTSTTTTTTTTTSKPITTTPARITPSTIPPSTTENYPDIDIRFFRSDSDLPPEALTV